MTHTRLTALGIVVVASLTVGVSATAQTTANGPYYAPPSWDMTLPANVRFVVLSNFNNEAVLDRETGLVWERSPSATGYLGAQPNDVTVEASFACANRAIGGRKGWRLPTIGELESLVDPSVPAPAIPLAPGHPFVVPKAFYWSATPWNSDPSTAWQMDFWSSVKGDAFPTRLDQTLSVWCVRGPNTR